MAQQFLTDKTSFAATLDNADLIHVVDVSDTGQNAAGSSYKLTLAQLKAFVTPATPTLNEVLTAGALTDGQNIIISPADAIEFKNTGATFSTYITNDQATAGNRTVYLPIFDGTLAYKTTTLTQNYVLKAGANEAVTASSLIYDNGTNVGIGESTPTARLHIKGSTSDNTAYALKVDNSSSTRLFYVQNDGRIENGFHSFYSTLSYKGIFINQSTYAAGYIFYSNTGATIYAVNDNNTYAIYAQAGTSGNAAIYGTGFKAVEGLGTTSGGYAGYFVGTNGGTGIYAASNAKAAVFTTSGTNVNVLEATQGQTYLKGYSSDSSAFALKVDNSASSPLFYVRNDGVIAINSFSLVSSAALKVKGRLIVSTQEVTANDNYIAMFEVGVGNGVLFSDSTNGASLNNQLGRIFGDGGLQIYGRNNANETKFFLSGKASQNRFELYSDDANTNFKMTAAGIINYAHTVSNDGFNILSPNTGTATNAVYSSLSVVNADATFNRLAIIGFTHIQNVSRHAFIGARFIDSNNGDLILGTKLGGSESIKVTIAANGEVFLNLPVSAGTAGSLWNDSGIVKVA